MSVREPQILSRTCEAHTATLQLRLSADLEFFRGHFDEVALLPGVVQVHWAITQAQQLFEIRNAFHRLTALKFMRVMTPGEDVTLQLDWEAEVGVLGFRYSDQQSVYSSGRVHFKVTA